MLPQNSIEEGETTVQFVATVSKLAAVEDVGPNRTDATATPARPSTATLKLSSTTRATLQSLRSPRNKLIAPVTTRDAETITDVCSGEDLPEVEIISLLEEQIPRYTLRADTLTQFQGYENADWFIPSPALRPEEADVKLSPDQIRETLNYFNSTVDQDSAEGNLTPEPGSSSRDLSSGCSNHEDDPYEYDEELPRNPPEDVFEGQVNGSPRDETANSSTRVTPCWGCRGCTPGTPLFLLGSPAEAPCTCVSFLCSNRVSQMTKTYNDIEAVTRLLEEKEKDLELTARIGKELLNHNQKLEQTINSLESDLKGANEKITQLSHELLKKTELIQILTNDIDESVSEADTPCSLRGINLEMMQRRIFSLEDENKQLKNEFSRLVKDADDCEAQEAQLVKDIASQLANANMEVDGIADELGRQKEENRVQHEQIISLTAKLKETELRLATLLTEHDEVGETLMITRENQNALAAELGDFKERYAEISHLLSVAQDELRKQRKRSLPTVRGGSLFPSMGAAPQPDSIACELELSLYSELSLDSGITADRQPTYKKVFDTVRTATKTSQDANAFPRIGCMTTSTLSTSFGGPRMSCGPIRGHLDSTGQSDSEGSLITECEGYPGPPPSGVPGAPGAADLEAALRRLTPAEVIARRACLITGTGYNFDYDGGIIQSSPPPFLSFGSRTPDSIMSTGSGGNMSGFSGNSNTWRVPEKLQIIKPIEGSQTLHHWSQLATPTLGGLLEDRPGVKTRGGRGLEDLGLETFTLADLEEDEEFPNPGKLFQDTGSVYTFTNSTVLHPEDPLTSVTSSVISSRVATAPPSAMNSGMNTPRSLSRRNSTSTFSTTFGLAKMLNERGIKAVTPSCVGTPNSERNFTPTATPCNSPDGTPPLSRSTSPVDESLVGFDLFYSGAELLKRTFSGETAPQVKRKRKTMLSRSDKKALTGIRLVEKLERIGISTIMATTGSSLVSPLALQGALCTRRSVDSPMAQLTFLKGSMSLEKLGPAASSTAGSDSKDKRKDDDVPKRLAAAGRGQGARRRGGGTTRPDLGQVTSASTPVTKESTAKSTFGVLSSLLFGRKGGLL